jgi:hypothetical protein
MPATPIPTPSDLRSAGSETMEELFRRIPPSRLVDKLERLLDATTQTKSGNLIADSRTQLAAAQTLVAYYVGRPVERQEVVSVNLDADSSLGIESRLANSPALREQLRRSLAAADAKSLGEDG